MSTLLSRLDGIDARFEEVGTLITDPSVIADQPRYVRLTKEYHDLELLTKATTRYKRLLADIEEAKTIIAVDSDPDMIAMGRQQLEEAQSELPDIEQEIKLMLIPADPDDEIGRASCRERV